jgi:hypothetical protein
MATPEELETLRERIANLLLSAPCQRIRFTIGGYDITPGAYAVIGMSIGTATASFPHARERRPINVQVSRLRWDVTAKYNPRANTIVVQMADYGTTPLQRVVLVHECTHAIFDLNRVRLDALTEEAACNIAGAMYLLMIGATPVGSGQYGIAERIAAELIPPDVAIPLPPRSRAVTRQQLDELISAIRRDSTYARLRPGYRHFHNGASL